MIYNSNDLLGFSYGLVALLPGLSMGVLLIRAQEVSGALKNRLLTSIILCILPFLLFALAELMRFFIYYNESYPLGFIILGAPVVLLAGNAVSMICFALNWRSNLRYWCGLIAITNAGYLLFGILALLNVRM